MSLARIRGVFRDLRFSMLDVRLGGRMLLKHPGLTVISTIAVAFAVAVGSVGFELTRQALWPSIPLPEGNAIVALQNWDVAGNTVVRASRRDYEMWRDSGIALTDISAVEVEERSVAVGSGLGMPETVANVTASTFGLTRVPALMGRTLMEGDEQGGAEPVAVVAYEFWKNRLQGAADAIGQVIRISGTPVTVVGVMPRGYGFPEDNDVWRPLNLERVPEEAPNLDYVFGRLAPGHSMEEVAVQAAVIGDRAAAVLPEKEQIRVQLLSLPDAVSELSDDAVVVLASMNVFLVLLAALLCGNVAMLLFARAVSRERELLVRSALGASRGRLIMQLFAEALLLCIGGALVGLLVARAVLGHVWVEFAAQAGSLPFWIDTSLTTSTVLYAGALTLVAAAIAGITPALKVTDNQAGSRLRSGPAGGGDVQFGGVWTVVVVAQVALMTLLPVPLLGVGADVTRGVPAGFAADEFLTATLAIDRSDGTASESTLEQSYRKLADRLMREPGVLGVTYADQLPGMRTGWRGIVMDSGPAAAHSERCTGGYCVGRVAVDPWFFDVVGTPVLRGRALTTADADPEARTVLVNRFFVEQVLGGGNPIGRQFRYFSNSPPTAESWYEIVGVVPDLGVSDNQGDLGRARVFQASPPQALNPLRVALHVRGNPQDFAVRLRELAQEIDPALRVVDPKPLPELTESVSAFWIALLLGFTGVTLMLSLAGVYAVTAFSVAKRTREIGVRVALGAQPMQIVVSAFKRPLLQITLGIGVGAVLALALANNDLSDVGVDDLGMTAMFVLSAVLCCALASLVPAWRALRIQPTEALRAEA